MGKEGTLRMWREGRLVFIDKNESPFLQKPEAILVFPQKFLSLAREPVFPFQ